MLTNYEKFVKSSSFERVVLFFFLFFFSLISIKSTLAENLLILKAQITGEKTSEVKKTQTSKIDINTASVKDLQKITGIGTVLAQRIIEMRPFYSLDELLKVNGIGPKTLQEIKKQGLAWVDPELASLKIEKTESLKDNSKEATLQPTRANLIATAERFEQTSKFLFVFLIALTLAIFSGTIILILQKKLKQLET